MQRYKTKILNTKKNGAKKKSVLDGEESKKMIDRPSKKCILIGKPSAVKRVSPFDRTAPQISFSG
jgi:hypothetical protein